MIREDEHLNLHIGGTVINGDNVVGFASPDHKLIPEGWADMARSNSFFSRADKKAKNHEKYLGQIELMATSGIVQKTFGADLLKSDAVLELDDSQQVVTYDVAIPGSDCMGFTIVQDSHLQNGEEPVGVDGSPFYAYFDIAPTAGDYLMFDPHSPFQVKVSTEPDSVTREGDKFKVYLVYTTSSKTKDFPKDALRAGTKYIKNAHPLAEYQEQWSSVTSQQANPGFIELEWTLGSAHGVESAWTMEAGNLRAIGAGEIATRTAEKFNQKIDKLSGRGARKTLFVTGRYNDSTRSIGLTHISSVLEILTMAEAYTIEATSNMFSLATIDNTNSNGAPVRINEGAWFQARRGKIITYPRPNALGLSQLQEAANYYFRNSDLPINERRITFVGGQMAVQQGQELINNYATQRVNQFPGDLLGDTGFVKDKGYITGSIDSMKLNNPNFSEVMFPGIGWVTFKHDPAFDFKTFSTGNAMNDGYYGLGGFNKLSYSLMVEGMDSASNVVNKVKGATVVEQGNRRSNLYYVIPKYNHVGWGYEQGRMNDGTKTSGIISSLKHRGQTFWVYIQSGMLMLDVTRNVIIELDNTYTR